MKIRMLQLSKENNLLFYKFHLNQNILINATLPKYFFETSLFFYIIKDL